MVSYVYDIVESLRQMPLDSSDDGGSFPSESDSEVDGVEEEQSGSGFESVNKHKIVFLFYFGTSLSRWH